MENKLISCYKLDKWNIITICFYLLLSYFLWIYCLENKVNQKQILFIYGFGTQFFIYGWQYRALRNFNYFLIWVVIGLVHFYIFLNIKNLPELAFPNGHAALVLRSTIISLFLFQFLRFVSLKIQNKELVMPAKSNRYDILNERKTTIVDVICFFIFMAVTIFIMIILPQISRS